MSNDGVALVTQIETRFGVVIPDEQVERLHTLGDLTEYLTAQAMKLYTRPCPAAWMFYRCRSVLLECLPLSKHDIRPTSQLADLIPGRARKRVWTELQFEFGHQLPSLQWPDSLRYTVVGFSLVTLLLMVVGVVIDGSLEYLFVLPFIWALVSWVAMMLAKPLARQISSETATPQALVRYLMPFEGLPYDQGAEAIEPWVFETIRSEVADALDVDAHDLTRQTDFIHDLGLK